jgi:hypothetical protein
MTLGGPIISVRWLAETHKRADTHTQRCTHTRHGRAPLQKTAQPYASPDRASDSSSAHRLVDPFPISNPMLLGSVTTPSHATRQHTLGGWSKCCQSQALAGAGEKARRPPAYVC